MKIYEFGFCKIFENIFLISDKKPEVNEIKSHSFENWLVVQRIKQINQNNFIKHFT